MISIKPDTFRHPGLEFGNCKQLLIGNPINKTDNKIKRIPFNKLGKEKGNMLMSKEAGFYKTKDLDTQYIFIPETIQSSFGNVFQNEVKNTYIKLYTKNVEQGFEPIIISYKDTNKSIYSIANEIIKQAQGFLFISYSRKIIDNLLG